ncbi:SGNH/GDSL hydrolase family protein [Prauserella muralis]|uniref:GDSL family lipase n=1 Tax=Prauserella muralis TaxID=588067 RepID=A0A2V4B0G8_9PSEU|nr:SGNH/GDSL hydrolase family protein [Prauserella muralis]PXY27503.1 GDSL family lipase [Prauserella muralis]TWE22778.1 GDSL-like lipase/acylhydrolase family protein [Prauserella muralis]
MPSRRRLLIVVVSVLSTLLAATATASASATETVRPRHYVALGDSYTSGPLIPLQRLNPFGCFRSTANYPSLVARTVGPARFTDVSCAGADTTHMTRAQQVTLGRNAPQFDALRADTDLVTLGIGGNDHGVFGRIVGTCPELRDSDPTGAPCQEHFTVDGVDTIKAAIAGTERNVAAVLAGIHERSPRATVLVIGYPRIAPPTGTCPDVLPFADGDYVWLNSVEETLNAALEKAVAEDGGATFVDMYPASLGHDACAGRAAWIQGKNTDPLAAASYHPRRSGMAGVAAEVLSHLS